MSKNNEADTRAAQEKISQHLKEARDALTAAQALADSYGLSFTFEATDGTDGELEYFGTEGGNTYSLGGDWYNSNC
jgi:hypothetical protein